MIVLAGVRAAEALMALTLQVLCEIIFIFIFSLIVTLFFFFYIHLPFRNLL